ncbi:hypothetical protein R1flu_007904 [Riccia fluitans]|uniref:Uncharacterized protein n=1 Tax=Riccia fluitans TaxID=41844 RepID=A0ABD1Z059_9MARC
MYPLQFEKADVTNVTLSHVLFVCRWSPNDAKVNLAVGASRTEEGKPLVLNVAHPYRSTPYSALLYRSNVPPVPSLLGN